jgi:hypothetical protein
MATASSQQLTTTSEYKTNVRTYMNSPQGNITYITKPMFPVLINQSQILLGENWTITCPLQTGHSYHIYLYGEFIDSSALAKTDYSVYVFDPQGNLESSHLESAGLPPHLGTTTDDPLFTPTQSGNYSFVISNNPFGGTGAQQATFMIIENLQCDNWYTAYLEGTNDRTPSINSNWAYEFETNASYVELHIKVPDTLDIYQARLYLMNNAGSPSLAGFPLAWEPGLYGNLSTPTGGYNFDPLGYSGVAYANDESMGQSLSLNYTSSNTGENLYHLVLIGGYGSGNIQLMLKTNFGNSLTPLTVPSRVYPSNSTEIKCDSESANLDTAQLSYTTDNWATAATLKMDISNKTCSATIPGQNAGSLVQYQIQALDVLDNSLNSSGNYTVKEPLTLNITSVKNKIQQGGNITINGSLTPSIQDAAVKVQFCSPNSTETVNCTVNDIGNFTATFKPNGSGLWAVIATSPETQTTFRCDSEQLMITVTPPPFYVKYSLFIIIGFVGVIAAGGIVYFLKFRNK